MGRRRWRIAATLTAFLLFVIQYGDCQDEEDFYYTPERNFAQVQPPIYTNNRPSTFFEHESFRVAPSAQQPNYNNNEGRIRFPNPNYNQNPSPFQLPTGRSQSGTQYYVNQPEVQPAQRQRFKPALPYNFQLVHPHPASTKRPDVSQIHSVAYQNNPSKPETFLGQITLNNPDIDYLKNSRFKNTPFDGNSLKSNGQSGHILHDDEIDNDDRDLFDYHKVTTYNPTKLANRQNMNFKPMVPRFSLYNNSVGDGKINNPSIIPANEYLVKNVNVNQVKPTGNVYQSSSTEYKSLLDIEPLLEDDISDLISFRELMKNNQDSLDVEVIKANNTKDISDSKPDASSMNTDNAVKEDSTVEKLKNSPISTTTDKLESSEKNTEESEMLDNEGEYVEYYDDDENAEPKHTTENSMHNTSSELVTDIYDEYDSTEETETSTEESPQNITKSFDVLEINANKSMMEDDNFRHFKDTPVIDQNDPETTAPSLKLTFSNEDLSSVESPSIISQEVVSVVTTKSVVNGTISIPDIVYPSSSPQSVHESYNTSDDSNNDTAVTTESWIVVASVQTSRSVSGARFLPFPAVEPVDEKKQTITEEDEGSEEVVTDNPKLDIANSSSTENINDKLDSIQSELSSAVLNGELNNENKNIELITESSSEHSTTSTTPSPVNVFTLKSTQISTNTEKSSPEPLPVFIKKFTPRVTTSTTPKPRKKPSFVTVMDDLSGLLPPGFKSKLSFKDKRTSTTSTTTRTTTTTTSAPPIPSVEKNIINATQGRSSGISSKNKVIILDDKSLLPKEYRPKEKIPEDLFKKIQKDDINKFLPPGYTPPNGETPDEPTILNSKQDNKVTTERVSTSTTTKEKIKPSLKLPLDTVPVDISSFLPPGFSLNSSQTEEPITITKLKITDIKNLLPPEFNLNESQETTTQSPSTQPSGNFKLVFPSRPGKGTRKPIPQKSSMGPVPVTPKIQKGWPTRSATEFTGWPSPSTTPFSIERLLELQRNSTSTTPLPEIVTEATTRRIATSTTTQAPPPPTTPGVCRQECDIAATIKIVAGVNWVPEFLDQHTKEWKDLAQDVKNELNSVYSKSDLLSKWYKGIRIDGFSQGSVLVDYFIELNNVEEKVDTVQLKKLFHKSLHEAKPGSVTEEEELKQSLDLDAMQGDQPDEERLGKSDEKMTKIIDKSAGKLEIGKFVMDPAFTEFIVLPKREESTIIEQDEDSLLPQWGIAVIVIAMASLLFVVIFGVTVLVNRQKSTKTKQPIPLSEDMLRELDKSHMGGFDDIHQLKERDLPYLPSGKRMSSAFIEQLAYPNPGDSWRSEWTPQLQKYMQHYTPDSGRGSQIYGATGNGYGYGGSQLYGQTGGGSQGYGYTGEYPRSGYSRRRSEYDSNF
ncbi:uncharacterized protein LOC126965651 [Leptidea sinapis]|uniref:uncharacterized protein LOC126965651 n=1 Tax=Leptidea sinapis TaxID=189913 RepID=UPI0021C42345|nr:uncharacterized protein LOC126965651 [Leptidea sinapis]